MPIQLNHTGAGVITIASPASGTAAFTLPTVSATAAGTNINNTFTAAQTFRAANAIRSEAASTQDAVILAGRAGGTSSFAATITPDTLSANRTLTLPDATGTVAVSSASTTFTAQNIFNASCAIVIRNGAQNTDSIQFNASGTNANFARVTITNAPLTSTCSRTQTLPDLDGTFVLDIALQTISGKRINPRLLNNATATTITPDISSPNGFDIYVFTALSSALTINAPTGSPQDGNTLTFRFLDNGTSRALTWNATYTAIGVTLPTATTANKTTYVNAIYNQNNTRWDVTSVQTQA